MLLRHSAIYLFARGIPGVINFLAIALYSRLLLPEEYGQYALVIAGVGFANAVFFQWLRLGLLRFLLAYQEQRARFLSTLVVSFIALVGLTGILGCFVVWLWPEPALRGLIGLGIGLLWLQAWFEINLEMARSQLRPVRYGIISATKAVISIALGGVLAYLGYGAAGVLVGLMLGMLVSVVGATRHQWRGIRVGGSERRILNQLLAYGLPLTATFALTFIISSSDRLLLGFFLDASAVGLYAVGYDLANHTLMMLMMVVNLAAYPLAVRALETKGKEAAQQQLGHNLVMIFAVAFPSSVGLGLLASNFAGIFVGIEFRDVATVLIPWIALASLMGGIKSYYLDLSFQLGKYTIAQVWVVAVAAIVNLGLNLWWIPSLGLIGAAYATVVAYFVALVLSWCLGRRIFPLPFPISDVAKVVSATVGMTIALLPTLSYQGIAVLVGQVAWGGVVYLLLLLALNVANTRNRLGVLCRTYYGGSNRES